jgi:hypothetical protein
MILRLPAQHLPVYLWIALLPASTATTMVAIAAQSPRTSNNAYQKRILFRSEEALQLIQAWKETKKKEVQ